jgi:hypothetical protein
MKTKPIGRCSNLDCGKDADTLYFRDARHPELGAICEGCRTAAERAATALAVLARRVEMEASAATA